MKEKLIKEIEKLMERCAKPQPIRGEDWLCMFYEISTLAARCLPEWQCQLSFTYEMNGKRSRYFELTVARWYPRINRFSTWERITCQDERYKDDYLVETQRKELKRKLKKIMLRLKDE